jgi:hypothetical protein
LETANIKSVNLHALNTPSGPYELTPCLVTDDNAHATPRNSTPFRSETVKLIDTKFSRIHYVAETSEFYKFGMEKDL